MLIQGIPPEFAQSTLMNLEGFAQREFTPAAAPDFQDRMHREKCD